MTEPKRPRRGTPPATNPVPPTPGAIPPVPSRPASTDTDQPPDQPADLAVNRAADTTTPLVTDLPADRKTVLAALTTSVLAVPGVISLEPTLSTVGPRFLLSRTASDGVRLHSRGLITNVEINVSTSNTTPARDIAHAIQRAARTTLSHHHHPTSTITVNILSIHTTQSPPPDNPA